MQVVSLAGAYMALIMGSGFASGQEILSFFTIYGFPESIGGMAIALFILSFAGARVMANGNLIKPVSTNNIYHYYCGQRLGKFFELLIPLIMFSFLTVMISGAGATFYEYYGLKGIIGRLFMALIVAATVLLGLAKLVKILGFLGIIIICAVVGMSISGLLRVGMGVLEIKDAVNACCTHEAVLPWWIAGLLYGSMNVTTAIPFLTGLGREASDVSNARFAGALGGSCFVFGAFVMNMCFITQINLVADKQIPFLWIAHSLHPSLGIIFSALLLGGIYTTAAPLLWSICDGIGGQRLTVFIVISMALAGSAFPFDALVRTIYPATGVVGLILLLCVFCRRSKGNGNTKEC